MAREKIGRLHADLSANSASFERDMKKARNATKNAASGMKRSMAVAGRAFSKVAKSLISFRSAAVLAAGAVGLGLLVRKAISTADEIAKTADKIGFTTKALQELRFAAGRAGIAQGDLDKALEQFTRRAGEAAGGTGEALRAYEDLGITLIDTNGKMKDSRVLLGEVADGLASIESAAIRGNTSYLLFGRQGLAQANLLLKDGKKGLDDYAAAAERLGIIIGEDLLRRAEKANDQIEDMGKVFAKTGTILALDLMPLLQDLVKLVSDPEFIKSIKVLGGVVTTVIKGVATNLGLLANVVAFFRDFFPEAIATTTREIEKLEKELVNLELKFKAAQKGAIFFTRKGPIVPKMEEVSKEIVENVKAQIKLEKQLEVLKGDVKPSISLTKTPPRPTRKTKPEEQIIEEPITGVFAPLAGAIDDAALERIEVDLARALQKAQGRFRVFGNQTKLAEERLAAFERAMDSLIEAGALEKSPELIEKLRVQIDVLRFSLEKTGDKTEEVFEGMAKEAKILERVFEGVFDSIDKALDSTVEGVLLGTRSMSSAFADLAQNVGLAIQKMIIDIAILDPLRNAIKGAGGIPGISSLVGNFIAGFFGAPSIAALPVAPPSALGLPGVSVPTAAHGGVFTAPTLALIGEEGPEAVIPLSQLREAGGDVTINVFNNSSARVQTSESRGVDGRKIISLLIEDEVKRNILSGGGVATAITQVFGANRQGAIR